MLIPVPEHQRKDGIRTGRLVHADDVGATPGGGTEDNFDLLPTRETPHRVVRDELGLETEVGKVGLDLTANEGAKQTETLSLASVNFQNLLLETTLNQLITGEPDVLGRAESLERDFVLVRLLELLSGEDLVDEPLLTLDDDGSTLLHLLLFLLRDLAGCLGHILQIFAGLVTPQHILEWGFVEMVVNVVEGVLGDITNDQVGVPPDFATLVAFHVTNEQLDEGRFTRTVRSKDGDAGGQGNLECDVVELLNSLGGILEANFAHLQQTLLLGLDTLKQRGIGELELVVFQGLESIVRLGLRDNLHEAFEVAAVSPKLEAVEMENIGDDVIEEARVVGDDDGSTSGQAGEVLLQPGDVNDVEMVRGLIEQEDVSLEQHGTSKSQLHLPTTGQTTDGMCLAFIAETDGGESRNDLRLISEDAVVTQDEVKDGSLGLRTVDVVLDVEGSDHIGGWEALNLTVERLTLNSD
jgi:hypothetical protein